MIVSRILGSSPNGLPDYYSVNTVNGWQKETLTTIRFLSSIFVLFLFDKIILSGDGGPPRRFEIPECGGMGQVSPHGADGLDRLQYKIFGVGFNIGQYLFLMLSESE